MSIREIAEITGYPENSISKIYNTLQKSGFDKLIEKHFAPADLRARKKTSVHLSSQRLALFDEYAPRAAKDSTHYIPFSTFCKMVNERDGTRFTVATLRFSFQKIAEAGLRPPLPIHEKFEDKQKLSPAEKRAVELADRYYNALEKDRKKGCNAKEMLLFVTSFWRSIILTKRP